MSARRGWLLRAAAVAVLTMMAGFGLAVGPAEAQQPGPTTLGGRVTGPEGPVARVVVDLFVGNENGDRLAYLRSAPTATDGVFDFELERPGCYVLTYIAPGEQTWRASGTRWLNRLHCLEAGQQIRDADAVLSGSATRPGFLGGRVTDTNDRARAGVGVDLFQMAPDGSRGRWLQQVATGGDGRFGHEVQSPACYVLTYIAPSGETWTASGNRWLNRSTCVEAGQRITNADAVLDAGDDGEPGVEQEILQLVNAARADAGCDPLRLDDQLTAAADGHSEDMAARNYFDHESPDGVGPGQRITDTGYRPRTWGENIAVGYRSAESVMNGWMGSDGHRRNILNCSFEDLGVGYATNQASNNRPYWTQVFGARR